MNILLPFNLYVSGLQDMISKNLLVSDQNIMSARVLAINGSTGHILNCAWWQRQGLEMGGPRKLIDGGGPEIGHRLNPEYPWYINNKHKNSFVYLIVIVGTKMLNRAPDSVPPNSWKVLLICRIEDGGRILTTHVLSENG